VPCANQGNKGSIAITAAGGTNYEYSINGGLTYQASNVFINLAPGTYQAVAKDGACASAVQSVTIIANPVPVVTLDSFHKLCINNGAVVLTGGQPAGGTYSGPGVVNGVFDPAAAGAGTHTITYTFTNPQGCSNNTTATIRVSPLPTISLANLGTVCISTPAFSLNQGTPPGGVYSGAGVSNNMFDPALAGAGTHTLTYTLIDTAGCTATASMDIMVEALPVVTFSKVNNLCGNTAPFMLAQGTPAGGAYSGPGVSGGMFSAVAAGAGSHTLTYTYATANGCSASATQVFVVNSLLTANAGSDKKVVKGYTPLACTTLAATATGGNGAYSYVWNTGATTASISVCPTVTTSYTVTVTDAAGCIATDQVVVNVTDATCGNKNDKVLVCHNGHEICISENAVAAHLAHGCTLGSCSNIISNGNVATNNGGSADRIGGGIVLTASPNPFGQITTINFSMAQAGDYTLAIYDLKGSLVKQIATGKAQANQNISMEVNGAEWTQGIYFARLVTGSEVKTTKLLLIK
jgi:hypothetical protein